MARRETPRIDITALCSDSQLRIRQRHFGKPDIPWRWERFRESFRVLKHPPETCRRRADSLEWFQSELHVHADLPDHVLDECVHCRVEISALSAEIDLQTLRNPSFVAPEKKHVQSY